MIHTNHSYDCSSLELAKKEIEIYLKYGIHPLIENFVGSAKYCEEVLAWMHEAHADAIYGVNILRNFQEAFRLAKQYGASFIQIDSVCGHLRPAEDEAYAKQPSLLRQEADVVVLGGVHFEYRPVCLGRSLKEDLLLGMERCDAIVCTGEETELLTPFGKVEQFKAIVKDFPVIVGAGVTLDTVQETFRLGDGAIMDSWFEEEHQDTGDEREEYVERMVEALCPPSSAPGPIKEETTSISYHHHTNSGMAIYTMVKLYPDYLVWEYYEARNHCHLKDTCRYNKEDFDKLVNELSKINFSYMNRHDHRVGGEGYCYSFEVNDRRYLQFNNSYHPSGDYHAVQDLIQQFIKSHPTQCEILFKKFAMMPHKRRSCGEFEELLKSWRNTKSCDIGSCLGDRRASLI